MNTAVYLKGKTERWSHHIDHVVLNGNVHLFHHEKQHLIIIPNSVAHAYCTYSEIFQHTWSPQNYCLEDDFPEMEIYINTGYHLKEISIQSMVPLVVMN